MNAVNDEKTLVMDAETLANEATITDNVLKENLSVPTEEIPRDDRARETDQNRSVETTISSSKTEEPTFISENVVKKGTGIGFIAGVSLSLLLIGFVAAGIYVASNYSDLVSGDTNSNSNSNVSTATKTRILSDSSEVKVSASSTRKPDKGNIYSPKMAFDGNPRTGWCEGARGAGKGQWIAFDFAKEVKLKKIVIQPGYFKTAELWRKNNRLSAVTIEFSDKSSRVVEFPDEMKEQTIDARDIKTKSVFIKIKDIYPGATDSKDTLISEVSFVVE